MAITRRDFLNGVALSVGAGLLPWQQLAAQQARYYPPMLVGLRGNHEGSNRYTHPLAFGALKIDIEALPIEEDYDLVVVGAGISGLASAWFYRQKFPQARILILDNHDDFGGHAKRNEMGEGENFRITYGGSESLDSPEGTFSAVAKELLQSLGVDYTKFHQYFQQDLYESHGMTEGIYFDAAHFRQDVVVKGDPYFGEADAASVVAQFPLSEEDKAALTQLFVNPENYFPEHSRQEIEAILGAMSYEHFLQHHVRLSKSARSVFQAYPADEWGYPYDGYAAIDGFHDGYPGFDQLDLPEIEQEDEPYIYHFPDGNASIARLLVRSLIGNVASGNTMEDVVSAQFDYAKLDLPNNAVRLRLNSTVAVVRNEEDGVGVVYLRREADADKQVRVRAKHCVMACYYRMMPAIAPQLPKAQQEAMMENVKIPFLYTKVLIKNWQAFKDLGVHSFYCPTAPYAVVKLDYPVSMGEYDCPREPEQAMVIHMVRATAPYGTRGDVREMAQLGRKLIYGTAYETLEQEAIAQLNGLLSPVGVKVEPLIEAITINRWAHGYSYEPKTLFDGTSDIETLKTQARQPLGNIHIANCDSGFSAYLQVAVDEAHRVVSEMS